LRRRRGAGRRRAPDRSSRGSQPAGSAPCRSGESTTRRSVPGLARARAVRSSVRRARGSCSDPHGRDVLEAVHLQPRLAEQGASVTAGNQGQVLGHQVGTLRCCSGSLTPGESTRALAHPQRPDPAVAVPADGAAVGLHPATEDQREGRPLVLAVAGHQQQFAAGHLQGSRRQEVEPPAFHAGLSCAEQREPFAEVVSSRLTELTSQFK
jgi:hypothetical protein